MQVRTDEYRTRVHRRDKIVERRDSVVWTKDWQSLAEYNYQGHFILKSALPLHHVEKLREAIDQVAAIKSEGKMFDQDGRTLRSLLSVHPYEPYVSMYRDPRIVEAVKRILGNDLYLFQSRINLKRGMSVTGWQWHSDFETWHANDGMPNMRCLTAMVPLTPNRSENGPLLVISKSHRKFVSCAASQGSHSSYDDNWTDQKDGVPSEETLLQLIEEGGIHTVLCEPGDVVLFDCNLIHGSNSNVTPFPRTNLFFVYAHVDNRLTDPYCDIPPRPEFAATRTTFEECLV